MHVSWQAFFSNVDRQVPPGKAFQSAPRGPVQFVFGGAAPVDVGQNVSGNDEMKKKPI